MTRPEPPRLSGLTRSQALTRVRTHFRALGLDGADDDARLLLFAACDTNATGLLRNPDLALSEAEAALLSGFVQRRANREPTTRIVGRRAFWSVDLEVFPDVLDPRADTEALIRAALRACETARLVPRRILDLGSGSGAALCALLDELPDAFGVACDLSPAACAATRANLGACGFAGRSAVLRGSWGAGLAGPFDLIVSNPPYIRTEEIAGLDPEVRAHDPLLALDGGGDGLAAYRAIFADAPRLLAEDGVVAVEFGAGQHGDVAAIAGLCGLEEAGLERDLGGHARAAVFRPPKPARPLQ